MELPAKGAALTVEAAAPFHIMTKPVGPICNLDCHYCYYLEKEALYPGTPSFRMPDDVLEAYIQQYIRHNPGPVVNFAWQGGEPTLMGIGFFRRAVELQKKYAAEGKEIVNAIQTNGTLLDDDWCRFLKENRFLVGISLDGPRELHDAYRLDKGGKPSFDKVMRGLKLLQDYGVEYNVLCVVNDRNVRHPLEVYRFFRSEGIRFIQFIPLVEPEAGGRVSPRSVPAEAWGGFLQAVFDEWVYRDVGEVFVQIFDEALAAWLGGYQSLCVFQETCGLNLAMEHNGDVYACDHFVTPEYRLGNIRDTALGELVGLPRQREFGTAKRTGLPRYCRECPVRFMCNGGCPKDRFIQTPDGEDGLNYLCAGYYRFFTYIDPYMKRMAGLVRQGRPAADLMWELRREREARFAVAGRNDPCPCGSGRKFKKCCLDKRAG